MMADPSTDWTTYIITTLITAVGSMIAAVIALAKIIETKYVREITELKAQSAVCATKTDVEILQLKKLYAESENKREDLAIKLARLETKSDILERKAFNTEIRSEQVKTRLDDLEQKSSL